MKSTEIDTLVQERVARFLKYQHLQIAAMEREDVPAGNRHFDRMYAALTQLANIPAGRDALERLMEHETPEIRLRAAGQVMAWAPEKAVPVLGRLVASWRPKDPRKGYVGVGTSAAGRLFDYFGVKDYDEDKLIEPLLTYGIELHRKR